MNLVHPVHPRVLSSGAVSRVGKRGRFQEPVSGGRVGESEG